MTIDEIISRAGGGHVIAKASEKTAKPITAQAVRKWPLYGIHDIHWPMMMRLAGVTVQQLFEANRKARRRAEHPSRRAPARAA